MKNPFELNEVTKWGSTEVTHARINGPICYILAYNSKTKKYHAAAMRSSRAEGDLMKVAKTGERFEYALACLVFRITDIKEPQFVSPEPKPKKEPRIRRSEIAFVNMEPGSGFEGKFQEETKKGSAEKKPAEKKPAEKKSAEKKPAEKKSAEKKPAEKKPAAKKKDKPNS